MRPLPILFLLTSLLGFNLISKSQIPETQPEIDRFIDSIGRSRDRNSITSSIYPGHTDGTNPIWRVIMWYNRKDQLLWIEDHTSDTTATIYFYCLDKLIFVDQFSESKQPNSTFQSRKFYFFNEKIIHTSNPEDLTYDSKIFVDKSIKYLQWYKLK